MKNGSVKASYDILSETKDVEFVYLLLENLLHFSCLKKSKITDVMIVCRDSAKYLVLKAK